MAGALESMALNYRPVIASIFGCFLLSSSLCYCIQSDIDCLKSVKESLEDPLRYLDSWNFNNKTEGFICRFIGVDCWHPDENKVLNIRLSNMELGGKFPPGLHKCEAMTGLDLSSNKINGSIPANISKIVGYLTTLDLSSNRFSGEIPLNLANCTYLNVIKLDNNQLTGQIPLQIGQLARMKDFSVANNRLIGQVPQFGNYSVPAENYANNLGLCGAPLDKCKAPSKKTSSGVIAGAAVGGVSVGIIGLAVAMYFIFRRASRKRKEDDPDGNKWAKSIKGAKTIKARTLFFALHNISFNTLYSSFSLANIALLALENSKYLRCYSAALLNVSSVFSDHDALLSAFYVRERPTYVSKAPESFKGSLVEWITILSGESKLQDSIDKSLIGKGYDAEVLQVLKVACRCVLPAVPKERPSMYEVYQLLRAIGEHYHFTTDDDILLLPTETEEGFQLEELIVARET
nr:probably inactive leucine-rich repeat receptor-like protein kinase At5g48380 [Ipomoea batatas]